MYGTIRLNASETDDGTMDGTFVASRPSLGFTWKPPAPHTTTSTTSASDREGTTSTSRGGGVGGVGGVEPPPSLHVPGVVLPDYVHMLYDDTASQPIIAEPRVVENLKEKGHVVLNLMDAYRTKLGSLQNSINGQVLAKRDTLVHAVAQTQMTMKMIQKVHDESRTKMTKEMENALLVLHHMHQEKKDRHVAHVEAIGTQLKGIQDFIMEATAPHYSQDVLKFLRMYPVLCEELGKIVAKVRGRKGGSG